jgi:diaminopimelate epimerase
MTEINYRQYHGTGNSFAVVEADRLERGRSAFARTLCADLGIDGVLFLDLNPDREPARIGFHLSQPDGSTAAMCGNGARVAARWGQERTGADEFLLETPAGPRRARIDGEDVTVEMGVPTFAPDRVPVDAEEPMIEEPFEGLPITAVNTGVPHAVAFLHSIDDLDLEAAAQPIRYAERFPEGANVTVAQKTGEAAFSQRTYERGVEAETRSCGTGAVAVAAVADRLDLVQTGFPVEVSPPGGTLSVTVPDDGPATLTGPTAFVEAGSATFDPEAAE